MSSYGNGKEHATTGHESFLQLFRKRVFSQTSSIHHHHPRMSRVGFSFGHEKTQKKGFLQPSIFPIKCVISDTKINDDTLYFRQLS